MKYTTFHIQPFLHFLDEHPQVEFDVTDGRHCAYAQYLCACGLKNPDVSSGTARFIDALGNTQSQALPVELNNLHCHAHTVTGSNIITYGLLAHRIRAHMNHEPQRA